MGFENYSDKHYLFLQSHSKIVIKSNVREAMKLICVHIAWYVVVYSTLEQRIALVHQIIFYPCIWLTEWLVDYYLA